MEWNYKNYKIGFADSRGTFYCKELGIVNKPSLDSVKQIIDKISKQEIKDTRAYDYDSYNNRVREVTLTSIDDKNYFWIKDEKGNRNKKYTLYKINEHNKKLFSQIADLKKEIQEREHQIRILEERLQYLKVEDIKKESKEG